MSLSFFPTGGKASLPGCRFFGDSVQAFRQVAHGTRPKQLQEISRPQPVRHSQESLYQHHAGSVCARVHADPYTVKVTAGAGIRHNLNIYIYKYIFLRN